MSKRALSPNPPRPAQKRPNLDLKTSSLTPLILTESHYFPEEILVHIFSHLAFDDLLSISLVSHKWRQASYSAVTNISFPQWRGFSPKFFRRTLVHYPHLHTLDMSGCDYVTDHILSILSQIRPTLITLNLEDCCNVTAKGLSLLFQHLSKLESLSLSGTYAVDSSTLEVLLTSSRLLTSLNISNCNRVSDTGLQHISHLPLRNLELGGHNRVTNKGLLSLIRCGQTLERLCISNLVNITDDGVMPLCHSAPHLRTFDIYQCPNVTDQSLQGIGAAIETLRLWGTRVSDKGLEVLSQRCQDLTLLKVANCLGTVSEDAIVRMSQRLPNLRVQEDNSIISTSSRNGKIAKRSIEQN